MTISNKDMNKKPNILIVDDNKAVLHALQLLLFPCYNKIGTLLSPVSLLNVLRHGEWDILLLDMNFRTGMNTGEEGLYWLKEVKRRFPHLPVVLFTAYGDVQLAVRGIKEGASDFVLKPWENEKLITTLDAVLKHQTKENKKQEKKEQDYWEEDESISKLRALIEKAAEEKESVQGMMTDADGNRLTLEEVEKIHIEKTIDHCNGNLAETARTLGITRQTLYNKMKKYGI